MGRYQVKVCVWGLAILIRSGEACYGPTCAHAAYPQQYAASQYYYAAPEQTAYQAYQTVAVPERTEDPKPTAWENFLTKHGKELIHITANTILQAGETIASVKKEKAHAATAVAGINLKCFQTSMGYKDSDGKVCTGPEHKSFSSSADHSSMSTSRRTSRSASSTMSSSRRASRSVSSSRSSSSRSNDSRGNREGSHDSNRRKSHFGRESSGFSEQFSSSRRSGEKQSKLLKPSSFSRSDDDDKFSSPKSSAES